MKKYYKNLYYISHSFGKTLDKEIEFSEKGFKQIEQKLSKVV